MLTLEPPPDSPKMVDVATIAAERLCVVAHPLQGEHEVEQAGHARAGKVLATQVGQVQVAEGVQPVIEGDDHHVAPPAEGGAVVPAFRTGAGHESPTVEPHHDRTAGAVAQSGSPDVQDQAVLTLRQLGQKADRAPVGLVGGAHLGHRSTLRADRAEVQCVAHPSPWRGRHRG